jgi:glycosyltransferase involved in cell wall biosynthesis
MPEPTEENLSEPARALRPGLVSVGLPVYNGARYLREAVDSILAQDYADFELIISDNCSEDETEAICREYAARDPRVRYYRAERNMGPAWNFLRVYQLARGEFFMWAAHDDRRAPRCLSLCVAALRESPRALMCCMGSRMIDAEGRDITDAVPFKGRHPTGASARERMRGLARATAWLDVYALFRTPVIAETRLGKTNAPGGDILFTAEVCMRGEVVAVAEPLLEYRFFQTKTPEEMAESQGLRGEDAEVSWLWFVSDLLECVRLAPLPRLERLSVGAAVAFETCARNPSLRWRLRVEGFRGVRRALSRGEYRRALRLAALGSLSQAVGLYDRVRHSASYRGGRIRERMKAEG